MSSTKAPAPPDVTDVRQARRAFRLRWWRNWLANARTSWRTVWIRIWLRLDTPTDPSKVAAKGREVPGTLIIAAFGAIVGVIATIVSYSMNWIMLYPDAHSHLVIARRVLDSQNTGFQQLGTVWLPVPHILLLPFVQNFYLFQTGLAGSILGIGCLAVSCAALWRITSRVGFNRAARLITIAVFVLNPAMLYLTTTALTEPVLIACILSALAGLSGWITAMPSISPGELAVFAGIPSALAVMSRYEGWAFVAVGVVFVTIASWRRWRSRSYTVTLVLSYVAAPAAAVLWWLSYNYVRYGDPLDFMRGQYSAAAQQQVYNNLGLLTTKSNLGTSVTVYNWSVENAIGLPILLIAGLGVIILVWERNTSTTGLLLWIPAFAYPFAILSLYAGQTIIQNDASLPPGFMFNNRYGTTCLLMAVLLVGVVVNWAVERGRTTGRIAVIGVLVVAIGFCAWSFADYRSRIGVLREGYRLENKGDGYAAAAWLGAHYDGGYILVDDVANDVLIPMGVPLDQLYASFNGETYGLALKDPYQYVDYVYANTANDGDNVWAAIQKNPNFRARFYPVFTSGTFTVWENTKKLGVQQ